MNSRYGLDRANDLVAQAKMILRHGRNGHTGKCGPECDNLVCQVVNHLFEASRILNGLLANATRKDPS